MMQAPMLYPLLVAIAPLYIGTAMAKSDCQCIEGFDPDAMPKMNVSDFSAAAHSNGTSM
jgi:hypothetical protein